MFIGWAIELYGHLTHTPLPSSAKVHHRASLCSSPVEVLSEADLVERERLLKPEEQLE